MNLFVEKIKENSLKGVIDALKRIAEYDEDFNGTNGSEYLWDISKQKGFSNNLDYVCDLIKKEMGDKNINYNDTMRMFEIFTDYWLNKDSYYKEYKYEVVTGDNEVPIALVISWTSNMD